MSQYEIEIGDTGEVREATDIEVEAIREHREDFKCQGKIRDDSDLTVPLSKPLLKCMNCGYKLKVRVRILFP